MSRAILFGGAEITNYDKVQKYKACKPILCCDRGLKHAHQLNLCPDVILGDFDSVDQELLRAYKEKKVRCIPYEPKKNATDLELGLQLAIEEYGAKDILIFGGIGNRFDHTLANVNLLAYALQRGVNACLMDEWNEVYITDSSMVIEGKKGDLVSVIPLGRDAVGVSNAGLEYPLHKFLLPFAGSRGVSNVMLGDTAEISVEVGMVVVIKSEGM